MTHLTGQTAFITGASLGIGAALAKQLYANGANVYLLARSTDKLRALADELKQSHPNSPAKIAFSSDGDVTDFDTVYSAVDDCIAQLGSISILVNNAGIALAAPRPFWEQSRDEIESMEAVNIRGLYNATHAVLNRSMIPSNKGTILNISSITGDNAPTFRGEACYHSHKKHMNGFSDVLRHELVGTDIKVLVLKPGCVKQTNFHPQRVGYSKELAEDFFAGFDQLTPEEVADGAVKMLDTSVKVSITSMTILPTPQRGYVNDTEWNARHSVE